MPDYTPSVWANGDYPAVGATALNNIESGLVALGLETDPTTGRVAVAGAEIGDTGQRDYSGDVVPPTGDITLVERVILQRVGNIVSLVVYNVVTSNAVFSGLGFTLPDGFRPVKPSLPFYGPVFDVANGYSVVQPYLAWMHNSALNVYIPAGSHGFQFEFTTADAWPAPLGGVPFDAVQLTISPHTGP